MSDVTQLMIAADNGDRHAARQLLPLVYDELRKLAARAGAPQACPQARERPPAHQRN